VKTHFAEFEASYPARYEDQYGFYRPVIGRVVEKFLDCGDLAKGFAWIRCDTCRHEYTCWRLCWSAAEIPLEAG
jgi:hypothetical protein